MAVEVRGKQPLSRPQKVRLAVEILGDYCRARWHLWRTDLPTAVARLRATPEHSRPRDEEARMQARVTGLRLGSITIRALGLLPTDSRCLVRSLVLTSLLARRGIPTSLVIGVTPVPEFRAHAWIEHDGAPLLPSGGSEFEQLSRV